MSNDDRDAPEFDEFDLSDEMAEPGDLDAQSADETDQPLGEDPLGDLGDSEGPMDDFDGPVAAGADDFDGPLPESGDDFDGPLAEGDDFDGPVAAEGDDFDGPVAAEGDDFDGPVAAEGEGAEDDAFALPDADDEGASSDESEEEESEDDEEEEEKKGLLAKLREASPYTVMLAISLGSILFAILLLFLSLKSYNLDIKAKEGTQRVGVAAPPQSGLPSTRAVA